MPEIMSPDDLLGNPDEKAVMTFIALILHATAKPKPVVVPPEPVKAPEPVKEPEPVKAPEPTPPPESPRKKVRTGPRVNVRVCQARQLRAADKDDENTYPSPYVKLGPEGRKGAKRRATKPVEKVILFLSLF
mgnify:CR=1 FL=1